jgi:hypothetical protein
MWDQLDPSGLREFHAQVGAEQHPVAEGGNKTVRRQLHRNDPFAFSDSPQQHQPLTHVICMTDS